MPVGSHRWSGSDVGRWPGSDVGSGDGGRGPVPWCGLAVPMVVSAVVVVLAVSAVAQIGSASGPYRRTVDRGYAALAGPLVDASNASGAQLVSFLHDGASLGRIAFFSTLDALASDTAAQRRRYDTITPPDPVTTVGCASAIAGRAAAVSTLRGALEGVLGGRTGLGVVDQGAAATAVAGAGDAPAVRRRVVGGVPPRAAPRSGVGGSSRRRCGCATRACSVPRRSAGWWRTWRGRGPWRRCTTSLFSTSSRTLPRWPARRLSPWPPPGASSPTSWWPTAATWTRRAWRSAGWRPPRARAEPRARAAHRRPRRRAVHDGGAPRLRGAARVLLHGGGRGGVPPCHRHRTAGDALGPGPGAAGGHLDVGDVLTARRRQGRPVTFIAELTSSLSGVGTPTGTVAFDDDGATIPGCGARPVHDAQATCPATYPAASIHAITAAYRATSVTRGRRHRRSRSGWAP